MLKPASKILAFLLTTVLAVTSFSGCGSNQKQTNQGSTIGESTNGSTSGTPEAVTLPISKDKLTLKVFMALDPKISATSKSVNDVAAYKELEKRTNIHIEFTHPPVGQENDVFNLMIASNDLTDIIYWNWPTVPGGPAKSITDNTIIKLNDSISKYAPNLSKLFKNSPEVKKQATLDDGTIFQFPMVRLRKDKDEWFKTIGPMIRQDWLDKLNLKAPKTIDELYTVLKAFKTQDPNGNGTADEIPLVITKDSGAVASTSSIKGLSSPWGILVDFYNDGGKVKYGPLEPGFKDYLETMNKWFKEGLIDSEFASTDSKSFDAKVTGNKGGYFIGLLAGNMGRYINLVREKDPKFTIGASPWVSGPAGKAYTSSTDYNKLVMGFGKAVSSKNKYVKESIKWLDYVYSEEGSMLMNFGIEGESYTMNNGYPAFTANVLKNPKGLSVDQALSTYAMSTANDAMVKDSRYFEQVTLLLPEQKASQALWDPADKSLLLPPITNTSEESTKLASIMNEVNTYTNEMLLKFIMGQEPISNLDKFVKNLKNMKIDDAIKLQQDALDRYGKR